MSKAASGPRAAFRVWCRLTRLRTHRCLPLIAGPGDIQFHQLGDGHTSPLIGAGFRQVGPEGGIRDCLPRRLPRLARFEGANSTEFEALFAAARYQFAWVFQ
jgi:hypothetical protein